mgnify:CR=1 FL=1
MTVATRTGTRIDEIADRIYRICTPVPPEAMPGGFTFNQYLLDDDRPLLFHTGMRALFPAVREAIESVIPADRLRYVAFGHVEADECGALNRFLAAAPRAEPVCGRVGAQISLGDLADRPARALEDGEALSLGAKSVVWIDAPHVPHNWENGFLYERSTGTLLCGDLFTRAGHDLPPLTAGDILGPAEAMRLAEPDSGLPLSYSRAPDTRATLERLAALKPTTLAVMHGSAWQGSGRESARMLRALGEGLAG